MMVAKTRILIVAAHHLANNIASNRFRELVRHFDNTRFEVDIITRADNSGPHVFRERTGVTVHALPGGCIGSGLSSYATTRVLSFALTGFRMRRLLQNSAWLAAVLVKADELVADGRGEFAAVIGTYSPIDAVIAARSVQRTYGIPSVLDFRDGFCFESLGRPGIIAGTTRRIIEAAVVRGSSLVTTVSRPLKADFESRYPDQNVALLPNGYDPEEIDAASSSLLTNDVIDLIPKEMTTIAHFGRVGASDVTRTQALERLVSALNGYHARDRIHVLFVGSLTVSEKEILKKLKTSNSESGMVDRRVALALMKEVDALILITGTGTGCATGKIFEYIAARRPVICYSLVENEAARILKETGAGLTILSDDDDGLMDVLDDLVSGSISMNLDEEAVASYRRDVQATELLRLIAGLNGHH